VRILVTGGAGYVGSHVSLQLIEAGYEVVILDNMSTGLSRVSSVINRICGYAPTVVCGDVRDSSVLREVFASFEFDGVIHLAAMKSVVDSKSDPIGYFDNNVCGSVALLREMERANVFTLVFSSSATVYGPSASSPISEVAPVGSVTNPYGRSKVIIEEVLKDVAISNPQWKIAVLRYFNPIGAHPSGMIGESYTNSSSNIVPLLARVASNLDPVFVVCGVDYPTRDGTGIRDYVHVVDVAVAHVSALSVVERVSGWNVWNIGTGTGYTVRELIAAFERASGVSIRVVNGPRRPGDVAECYANPGKAYSELGWRARFSLDEMMCDAWRWYYLGRVTRESG
jgi:UDP-glucose 4-epimerase